MKKRPEPKTEISASFVPPHIIQASSVILNLGDQMDDGSYYMGVSPVTSTNLYVFFRGINVQKRADTATFHKGTKIMRARRMKESVLNGHVFSGHLNENDIIFARRSGLVDDGVRRLTKAEWHITKNVFNLKPALRELAQEVCGNHDWVQTGSSYGCEKAWFYNIKTSELKTDSSAIFSSALLLGRSDAYINPVYKQLQHPL